MDCTNNGMLYLTAISNGMLYLTAINNGMLYVIAINNDMLYLKAMSNSNHFENYICMQQGIRAILGYNQLCVSRNAYNREFVQSLFMGQPMDRLELVQILNKIQMTLGYSNIFLCVKRFK